MGKRKLAVQQKHVRQDARIELLPDQLFILISTFLVVHNQFFLQFRHTSRYFARKALLFNICHLTIGAEKLLRNNHLPIVHMILKWLPVDDVYFTRLSTFSTLRTLTIKRPLFSYKHTDRKKIQYLPLPYSLRSLNIVDSNEANVFDHFQFTCNPNMFDNLVKLSFTCGRMANFPFRIMDLSSLQSLDLSSMDMVIPNLSHLPLRQLTLYSSSQLSILDPIATLEDIRTQYCGTFEHFAGMYSQVITLHIDSLCVFQKNLALLTFFEKLQRIRIDASHLCNPAECLTVLINHRTLQEYVVKSTSPFSLSKIQI